MACRLYDETGHLLWTMELHKREMLPRGSIQERKSVRLLAMKMLVRVLSNLEFSRREDVDDTTIYPDDYPTLVDP